MSSATDEIDQRADALTRLATPPRADGLQGDLKGVVLRHVSQPEGAGRAEIPIDAVTDRRCVRQVPAALHYFGTEDPGGTWGREGCAANEFRP